MSVKPAVKKHINIIWLLLYGAALIAVGVIVLVNGELVAEPAARIGGIFISANGIHRLIRAHARKKKLPVFSGIGNILIGTVTVLVPAVTLSLLSLIFSLYVFLNALVKFIDFASAVKNGVPDAFFDLFAGIFFTVFGVIMLFGTLMGGHGMLIVIGIYCILYGVGELRLFLREAMPNRAKGVIRRRIRFSLPQFITTFIPLKTLKSYCERIDSREIDIESLLSEESIDKCGAVPDVHILIHVSNDGVGTVGHCDLMIDNTVISYGNYDKASERLMGGIGDGVLFKASFERYVRFGVHHDNQMIFDFGIKLTEKQLEKVKKCINKIEQDLCPWEPPFQLAYEKNPDEDISRYDDYCSKLWNGTHADFYKFTGGRFKTYFVMSTNCVLLADYILSKAGTDIVKTAGIITPGAYYDYLQNEYALPSGIVVTRDIYCKYNVEPPDNVNF